MPYHLMLDHAGEAKLGKLEIGTTKRGIGPCYADKAARLGIRVQDMLDEKILKQKIISALEPKKLMLRPFEREPALDLQAMTEQYLTYGHRLEQHIADTASLLHRMLDDEQLVIFEGAQAALLDIDHGTYPFVTSSNPVAGAACVGAGVGPRDITEVWGVAKAYATRVGAGPFPTELDDETRRDAARARRRVRHDDRPPAAHRLDRPRRAPLRGADQRDDGARHHQARRAQRLRDAASVCTGYQSPDGASFETFPYHQTRAAPRAAGLRGAARLDRGHHRHAAARRSCPRRRATTCASSRTSSACRSCLIGVGPARDQIAGWTLAAGRVTRRRLRCARRRRSAGLRAQRQRSSSSFSGTSRNDARRRAHHDGPRRDVAGDDGARRRRTSPRRSRRPAAARRRRRSGRRGASARRAGRRRGGPSSGRWSSSRRGR